MERRNKWIKEILLIAGTLEIITGLAHFSMPYFAFQAKGFSFLNQNEIQFVTLCVFAVGILLIAFGILTILFSMRIEERYELVYFYTIVKSFLWLSRIILEIVYPVNIPLFLIEQPTILIKPLLIFECMLFICATVLITLKNRKGNYAY